MNEIVTFSELKSFIGNLSDVSVFLLTDSGASDVVLPVLFNAVPVLADARRIVIESGDENKNLQSLTTVWSNLVDGNGTRRSVLINVGGGMVTDLGGFAAATFKRGIRCVNIPTTLLAMVDASVGGKTGINFNGLKNEIGVFSEPELVVIEPTFLRTLPRSEFLSGYAEMLKTGLIADRTLFYALLQPESAQGYSTLLDHLLRRCITIKTDVVAQDAKESGLRKILNYGHTAGHAFESLSLRKENSVPHGVAVAWGLVTESVLSHLTEGFDTTDLYSLATFIKEEYPYFPFSCKDYDELMELMRHDKKNRAAGEINFTLLRAIGKPVIDCHVDDADIRSALDITLDLLS